MSHNQTFIPAHQKKWCLDIYSRFLAMNITSFISQEMEKDENQSRLTFQSIRNRLQDNSYMSPDEWIRDVNSVLYLQKTNYKEDTPQYYLVSYLEKWFHKKVKEIPQNESEIWMLKYKKVQRLIKQLQPPGNTK